MPDRRSSWKPSEFSTTIWIHRLHLCRGVRLSTWLSQLGLYNTPIPSLQKGKILNVTQSAGAVEYTDGISAEGQDHLALSANAVEYTDYFSAEE